MRWMLALLATAILLAPTTLSPAAALADADSRPSADGAADDASVPTASIIGWLSAYRLDGSGPVPLAEARGFVIALRFDEVTGEWETIASTNDFGPNGMFSLDGLPGGDYIFEFTSYQTTPVRGYYRDQRFWADATVYRFAGTSDNDIGDIALRPRPIEFLRIHGVDRYSTAARISQAVIPTPERAPVVYLVSGTSFADALSAGPAAARGGGVVLMTAPTSLPSVVASEITRLAPHRVVIVGGPAAISDGVEAQVRALVSAGGEVERIFGSDRYETSRAIVSDAFGESVEIAFVATGQGFADALSAGPAASVAGGPLILVDGTRPDLDAGTRELLIELGVTRAFVAGGPAAVSVGIEDALDVLLTGEPLLFGEPVTRYSGDNRYETARLVNSHHFAPVEEAFVASGAGFADALAGTPLAAAVGAPIYLAPPSCIRNEDYATMVFSFVRRAYVLGGPAVLTDSIIGGARC